ncbi:M48 family metallopeptidase [candidate division WOR-3 bacterium]|nr:M48 family metallopeptidase [candidate division WOR-3 bacterium]
MNAVSLFLSAFIFIILLSYLIELIVDLLRIRKSKEPVPDLFQGFFDEESHQKYIRYNRKNSVFSIFENTVSTIVFLVFLISGGFNYIDIFARSFGLNEIFTGVVFFFTLFFLSSAINLPFSYYSKFRIENEFGFNRTTHKTFFLDIIKGLSLTVLIGAPVSAMLIWFFLSFGSFAWVLAWSALSVFQVIMAEVAPVLIMPLFNKFRPINDGELKDKITDYAKNENFKIKGIFQMDGSRRTTKPNAYFTGIGKSIRIVLFDTLIEKLTPNETVGVLAHEAGHFRKKHVYKTIAVTILASGLMLFLLSVFVKNSALTKAFKIETFSIYAGMASFAVLYQPVSFIFNIAGNFLSRKFEFEADRYAVTTTENKKDFAEALKKIYVTSFGDLNPHPFDVLINYSHPPVISRLRALQDS